MTSILNRLKAVQNKRPFSNLFPRGVKSEAVDFHKITVSLDFLPDCVTQAGLLTLPTGQAGFLSSLPD
jgi:hypothetical protein